MSSKPHVRLSILLLLAVSVNSRLEGAILRLGRVNVRIVKDKTAPLTDLIVLKKKEIVAMAETYKTKTMRRPSVIIMLGRRRRRRASIIITLSQRLVFDGQLTKACLVDISPAWIMPTPATANARQKCGRCHFSIGFFFKQNSQPSKLFKF